MIEAKNVLRRYLGLQGSVLANNAIAWANVAIQLRYYGFAEAQIGVITSLAALSSVILQQIFSAISDRHAFFRSYRALKTLVVTVMLASLTLWLTPNRPMFLTGALIYIVGICCSSVNPFVSAMVGELSRRGYSLNYGLGRGIGSLMYAICAYTVGQLVGCFTPSIVHPIHVVDCVLILFCIKSLHKYLNLPETEKPSGKDVNLLRLLQMHPQFTCVVFANILIQTGYFMMNTYMSNILLEVGGNAASAGIAIALAALVEVPAMAIVKHLHKRFSCLQLLLFSAISMILKLLALSFVQTEMQAYLAQILQFSGYGFLIPTTVYYVQENIDPHNQVKGQSIIYAAGSGIGATCGNLICGLCTDAFNIRISLLIGMAITIISLPMLYYASKLKTVRAT